MTESTGEPFTIHDVLEWMRDLLVDEWRAPRVQKPTIDLRGKVGDVRVENGDYVLLYFAQGTQRENVGTRHRHEHPTVSLDIRAYRRADALMIRDELLRILDYAAVAPDPYGEWDELILLNDGTPADYADYTQIVLDVEVHKYLRLRQKPRLLGGTNP